MADETEETEPTTKRVKISDINQKPEIQIRTKKIDKATVEEYAGLMKKDTIFPPIDVFFDEDDANEHAVFIADGHHRLAATIENGDSHITATIHAGGIKEAIALAMERNAKHGLALTTADKRRGVRLLMENGHRGKTNLALAKLAGVSPTFVADIRVRLATTGDTKPIKKTKVREHERTLPGLKPETGELAPVVTRARKKKPTTVQETSEHMRSVADWWQSGHVDGPVLVEFLNNHDTEFDYLRIPCGEKVLVVKQMMKTGLPSERRVTATRIEVNAAGEIEVHYRPAAGGE